MSPKKDKTHNRSRAIVIWFVCVVFLGGVLFAGIKHKEQSDRIAALNAEYEALSDEYDSMLRREEQLEYMVEYVKTDEYLLQIAREQLGYVFSSDIIFETEE